MAKATKVPEELLDHGVRLVFGSGRPIAAVARDLGVHPEALRKSVRQTEAKLAGRPDVNRHRPWLAMFSSPTQESRFSPRV